MTIFVTWHLRMTLDSIGYSCDVLYLVCIGRICLRGRELFDETFESIILLNFHQRIFWREFSFNTDFPFQPSLPHHMRGLMVHCFPHIYPIRATFFVLEPHLLHLSHTCSLEIVVAKELNWFSLSWFDLEHTFDWFEVRFCFWSKSEFCMFGLKSSKSR